MNEVIVLFAFVLVGVLVAGTVMFVMFGEDE